jgi:hypothetical protein
MKSERNRKDTDFYEDEEYFLSKEETNVMTRTERVVERPLTLEHPRGQLPTKEVAGGSIQPIPWWHRKRCLPTTLRQLSGPHPHLFLC